MGPLVPGRSLLPPPRHPGETAVGGTTAFVGSLGTQVVKVFELAVARTGFLDAEASAAGLTGSSYARQAPPLPAAGAATVATKASAEAVRTGRAILHAIPSTMPPVRHGQPRTLLTT